MALRHNHRNPIRSSAYGRVGHGGLKRMSEEGSPSSQLLTQPELLGPKYYGQVSKSLHPILAQKHSVIQPLKEAHPGQSRAACNLLKNDYKEFMKESIPVPE